MSKSASSIRYSRTKRSGSVAFDPAAVMCRASELLAGQSLRQRASLTGLRYESIRRYHAGICAPSLEYIARVCLATGVSANWLLFGKGGGPDTRSGFEGSRTHRHGTSRAERLAANAEAGSGASNSEKKNARNKAVTGGRRQR